MNSVKQDPFFLKKKKLSFYSLNLIIKDNAKYPKGIQEKCLLNRIKVLYEMSRNFVKEKRW